MKAFDIIGAVHEQQQPEQYESEGEYYEVNQTEELRIPINKKVEIELISHELRKPKFHLIKTKQPPIHIIGSKKNYSLGLDTQTQRWSTGGVEKTSSPRGFFNKLMKSEKEPIQQSREKIANENQNQQINPFLILKNRFPQILEQNILSQMSLHHQGKQRSEQRSEVNLSSIQSQPDPLNNSNQESERISNPQPQMLKNKPVQSQILASNFFESQVRQVHLADLPQNMEEDSLQVSLGQKIANFFTSFKRKVSKSNQQQIKGQRLSIQNKGFKTTQSNIFFASQVQNYNPHDRLSQTIKGKQLIEESIII